MYWKLKNKNFGTLLMSYLSRVNQWDNHTIKKQKMPVKSASFEIFVAPTGIEPVSKV
jgi:hypothetical protein